jgi:hypothetical protein
MPSNIDYFIEYCRESQIFHFLNKNFNPVQFLAKGGADKRSPVLTGKPEIKHPLEATVKNKLERELGSYLPPDVMLHIGGDNRVLLNLFMADALTVNNDIYIREESYKEGSEETDKILLHEMVHVLQNKNNVKIKSADERKKAEAEAEQAERDAYGDIWAEPVEIIEKDGKIYKYTQKQKKVIIYKIANDLEDWVEKQKILLPEEEYLELLCDLQYFRDDRLRSMRTPKDAYEAMQIEIEEEFRRRLL